MKIGVRSDGTLRGTCVYDVDTGEKIDNVVSANIYMSVDRIIAELEIFNPEIKLDNIEVKKNEEDWWVYRGWNS